MTTPESSRNTDYTLTRQEADYLRRSNSYKPSLFDIPLVESHDPSGSSDSDNEVNHNFHIMLPFGLTCSPTFRVFLRRAVAKVSFVVGTYVSEDPHKKREKRLFL